MSKEADFSQFEKYVKDFSKMINDLDSFLRQYLLEMAQRVIARTKPRTPVDTGYLRESWYVGDESKGVYKGQHGQGNAYTSAFSTTATIQSIRVVGDNLEVDIGNGAEYSSYVEYGHASQAGNWVSGYFMLTISIDEVQKQMPKRFEKAFQEFIKSKGVG